MEPNNKKDPKDSKDGMGDDNTLVNVPVPPSMGSRNTIIGPTDLNGNTILGETETEEEVERETKKKKQQHPFIEGLIMKLPEPGTDWPMDARKKWLQAASHLFELMYKDDDGKGSLTIEVKKDSGK